MLPAAALLLALLLPPPPAGAAGGPPETRVMLATDDGWNLNARYQPAAEGATTIVLVHTQKSDLTEWEQWFPHLRRLGYGYLAMDLRGHGNSFVTPEGDTATWKSFANSGAGNEYNRMLRDVEAALAYLAVNSSGPVALAGSVLGANLAIKAAALHPEVTMVMALSPALNVNDVLVVNPLRAYGQRPLLLAAGADRERQYREMMLLNDIAKQACGPANVTVIVEPKGIGPSLINKYNLRRYLEWFRSPRLPDTVELSTAPAEGAEAETEEEEE